VKPQEIPPTEDKSTDFDEDNSTDADEKAYSVALKNVPAVRHKYLKVVDQTRDSYRREMNEMLDLQPTNKYKYKLEAVIAESHFLAQQMASYHFRQEKMQKLEDEECYMVTPWKPALTVCV